MVVVGAGVAGLAAAERLSQAGLQVCTAVSHFNRQMPLLKLINSPRPEGQHVAVSTVFLTKNFH